jgi:hypothetical protein
MIMTMHACMHFNECFEARGYKYVAYKGIYAAVHIKGSARSINVAIIEDVHARCIFCLQRTALADSKKVVLQINL